MNDLHFDDVDVLAIDPDKNMRMTLRTILQNAGMRRLTVGAGMADIEHKFYIGMPDLLICDMHLEDGDFADFVYRLRHHEIGSNPFLPIIATTWSPTQDDVKRIVQAGADDMVTKPFSTGQLLGRLKHMINSRKPFVVTSNYIGPDRRPGDKVREGSEEITPVVVPNPLRVKATGNKVFDLSAMQAEIDQCIKQVNVQKLDRHGGQVTFLVDRIVPGLAFGEPDETTKRSLQRLLYVAEDASRRLVSSPYAHVGELCQSLIDVTSRIIGAGDMPAPKDVDLLKPLSQAIARGFTESGSGSVDMAREISQSVSTKK